MNYELRCRECGKSWGNQPRSMCDDCFSPLEVFYDYDALRSQFTRDAIARGPANMWRYSALLPLPEGLRAHRSRRIHPAAQGSAAGAAMGRAESLFKK